MRRKLIVFYYDLVFKAEDVFGFIEKKINDHRRKLDDKYWDKYIDPKNGD